MFTLKLAVTFKVNYVIKKAKFYFRFNINYLQIFRIYKSKTSRLKVGLTAKECCLYWRVYGVNVYTT